MTTFDDDYKEKDMRIKMQQDIKELCLHIVSGGAVSSRDQLSKDGRTHFPRLLLSQMVFELFGRRTAVCYICEIKTLVGCRSSGTNVTRSFV